MSGLSAERRSAFERNEKSQHAPNFSTKDSRADEVEDNRKKRHPSNCSCCSGDKSSIRSSAVYMADGSKVFPSKRPWMISH
ncbi:hypothetical protein [Roseibium algae]|uniref:Uncharacterized protein n=1 Tax=Roseibium algae TaxID=3123038 RepID=A0ABU8TF72_9HYPH